MLPFLQIHRLHSTLKKLKMTSFESFKWWDEKKGLFTKLGMDLPSVFARWQMRREWSRWKPIARGGLIGRGWVREEADCDLPAFMYSLQLHLPWGEKKTGNDKGIYLIHQQKQKHWICRKREIYRWFIWAKKFCFWRYSDVCVPDLCTAIAICGQISGRYRQLVYHSTPWILRNILVCKCWRLRIWP